METINKRCPKPIKEMKQRGKERQLLLLQSWKSDNALESNREKLFYILGGTILFSLTIHKPQ